LFREPTAAFLSSGICLDSVRKKIGLVHQLQNVFFLNK